MWNRFQAVSGREITRSLRRESSLPPLDLDVLLGQRLGWMEALPVGSARIADVAARAGVGVATVSRVLNGRAHVSPVTRERVLDAMRVLDYRPSSLARN